MNKRALSAVIANIILVAIAMIVVAIVFVFIINIVGEKGGQTECLAKATIQCEQNVKVAVLDVRISNNKDTYVTIKNQKQKVDGFVIKLQENMNIYTLRIDKALDDFSTDTYKITEQDVIEEGGVVPDEWDYVEVFPMLVIKDGGEECEEICISRKVGFGGPPGLGEPVLIAEFSCSPRSNSSAPLTTNCTDRSSSVNRIDRWLWNVNCTNEKNYVSENQNPSFTIEDEGECNVSLTVYEGENSDTELKKQYLKVGGVGEFISPFNLFFQVTATTSWEDLNFSAHNAKLVRATYVLSRNWGPTLENLQLMKQENPELHISLYANFRGITLSDPNLTWMNNTHPDWFMRCPDGSRVQFIDRFQNYLANINNPEYRLFWIQRAENAMDYYGEITDVLFMDVATAKIDRRIINCDPVGYTDDAWYDWAKNFIQQIKAVFPNKTVIPNSIKLGNWESGEKFLGFDYAAYADGIAAETWVHRWGLYVTEENWKILLDNFYMPILKQEKFVAVVQHPERFEDENGNPIPGNNTRRMFGIASYLLLRTDVFGFTEQTISVGGEEIQKHPIFYIPLGEPTNPILPNSVDEYLDNGVYVREYQNGLALVNPSETEPKTYTLGREMTQVILEGNDSIRYETVQNVTLSPISGAILISEL